MDHKDRSGGAQSGSSASRLIPNMTNVHMRIDAKQRRCGGAETNRLTKTALQQADPTPVPVLSQDSYSPVYVLKLVSIDVLHNETEQESDVLQRKGIRHA